ncbi:MAG: aspartate/glutamate racemase family protein [Pseudomonadota bacterium]
MNKRVKGGTPLYGVAVGVLMLEARFPRILGDMGHAQSWPFPVHYRVVRGATPDLVVRRRAEGTLDAFIDAARTLVADGVRGITTNCGFLSLFQEELSRAVAVPVLTSSLMQVAMVNRLLPPGKRAGILTINQSSLTPEHLHNAQVPEGTPIATTEGRREFTRVILQDEPEMDIAAARQDNIDAAGELAANQQVGAIVLECTNMTPYVFDIARTTNLPVFSIFNLVRWMHEGLTPPSFSVP